MIGAPIKVLGGSDWAETNAYIGGVMEPMLMVMKPFIGKDKIPLRCISRCQLVTQENRHSVLGAISASYLGGLVFGPAGLIAGAVTGGRGTTMTLLVELTDGRSIILEGPSKHLKPLLVAGMTNAAAPAPLPRRERLEPRFTR